MAILTDQLEVRAQALPAITHLHDFLAAMQSWERGAAESGDRDASVAKEAELAQRFLTSKARPRGRRSFSNPTEFDADVTLIDLTCTGQSKVVATILDPRWTEPYGRKRFALRRVDGSWLVDTYAKWDARSEKWKAAGLLVFDDADREPKDLAADGAVSPTEAVPLAEDEPTTVDVITPWPALTWNPLAGDEIPADATAEQVLRAFILVHHAWESTTNQLLQSGGGDLEELLRDEEPIRTAYLTDRKRAYGGGSVSDPTLYSPTHAIVGIASPRSSRAEITIDAPDLGSFRRYRFVLLRRSVGWRIDSSTVVFIDSADSLPNYL